MSATKGLILASNISVVGNQPAMTWTGGRASIVIIATTYPTACSLQCLAPDNATWINLNSATYAANQVTPYDLPAGQYRLAMSGGTVAGLYANLVGVPYV